METATRGARSRFGDFAEDDEREKADQIAQYLADHASAILPAFNAAVRDPARRAAARQVVESGHPVDPTRFLPGAADVLYYSRFQREAASFGLAVPLYSTIDEFRLNSRAPVAVPPLAQPDSERRWPLLGRLVGFPIGVPASALTGSPEWIAYLAHSGYNVLTFKTVRSRSVPSFAKPNWVILPGVQSPLDPQHSPQGPPTVVGDIAVPLDFAGPRVSTANSFGVPSPEPEVWQQQVQTSLLRLTASQILIVSVMGDHYGTESRDDLVADYVRAAQMANDAGAGAIELNVSCPNTLGRGPGDVKPPLCEDIDLTADIAAAVRAALPWDTTLSLKISYLDPTRLEKLVLLTQGYVDAYSAINTLQSRVVDQAGLALFRNADGSNSRPLAGISGIAIRDHARLTVRRLALIRNMHGYSYEILGMGGVTDEDSFRTLFSEGAAAVQSASGAFANSRLAQQCFERYGDDLPITAYPSDHDVQAALEAAVARAYGSAGATELETAAALPFPISQTYEATARLLHRGQLRAIGIRAGYDVLVEV